MSCLATSRFCAKTYEKCVWISGALYRRQSLGDLLLILESPSSVSLPSWEDDRTVTPKWCFSPDGYTINLWRTSNRSRIVKRVDPESIGWWLIKIGFVSASLTIGFFVFCLLFLLVFNHVSWHFISPISRFWYLRTQNTPCRYSSPLPKDDYMTLRGLSRWRISLSWPYEHTLGFFRDFHLSDETVFIICMFCFSSIKNFN